ncbi:hypothetical protein PV-S19_0026 [Pacmanvirus S19]|nr:hypothetical protein PV-S19_0026 [Pacmanvirus S19]
MVKGAIFIFAGLHSTLKAPFGVLHGTTSGIGMGTVAGPIFAGSCTDPLLDAVGAVNNPSVTVHGWQPVKINKLDTIDSIKFNFLNPLLK